MSTIEQRARLLLAAEYENSGEKMFADRARNGRYDNDPDMRAIVAALTPAEGWVLVPVEPTEAMKVAGSMWNTEMDQPPEFSALMSIWKDMLAARPEVKP